MAPRRTNNVNDQPVNDWEELRRTLITMQENLQATIHDSIRELAEAAFTHHEHLARWDRRTQHDRDRERDREDVYS